MWPQYLRGKRLFAQPDPSGGTPPSLPTRRRWKETGSDLWKPLPPGSQLVLEQLLRQSFGLLVTDDKWMYVNNFMHKTTKWQPAVCPISKLEIHNRGCLGF